MLLIRLHCQVESSLAAVALLAPFMRVLLGLTVEDAIHRLLHHHLRTVVALHVVVTDK